MCTGAVLGWWGGSRSHGRGKSLLVVPDEEGAALGACDGRSAVSGRKTFTWALLRHRGAGAGLVASAMAPPGSPALPVLVSPRLLCAAPVALQQLLFELGIQLKPEQPQCRLAPSSSHQQRFPAPNPTVRSSLGFVLYPIGITSSSRIWSSTSINQGLVSHNAEWFVVESKSLTLPAYPNPSICCG